MVVLAKARTHTAESIDRVWSSYRTTLRQLPLGVMDPGFRQDDTGG